MIDVHSMSVLIVDDMENMVKSVRGMMKVMKFGKEFFYANNGKEAWKLLQKNPVDLAIVDWNMPIMTGVELLNFIREDRNLRNMPVIMVTAEANKEIVAEAGESDIDAYLLKPLTVKSLEDKILNVIDKANNPPPMIVHLRNALALEDAGNYDAAIAEAMKAAKLEPNSTKPLREIGYLYFKKGDLETAEKIFLKATEMNDLDVIAFHRLGELYLKKNEIDKASKYFDRAMDISPRHVSRGVNFGKVLVQNNMKEKAAKVFTKAISLSDNSKKLTEEIANFCMGHLFYDYASRLFSDILKKQPDRHDILFKAGIAQGGLKNHMKALEFLNKAEKKDRDNVDIKLHMAKNYKAIGKLFRAEEKLKEILDIDPDHNEARLLFRKNL